MKILKIIIRQLTPYYCTTIVSIGSFFIGVKLGSFLDVNPNLVGFISGLVPVSFLVSFIPVHYEREVMFKLKVGFSVNNAMDSEVLKSIIMNARKIEREMNITDTVSYVFSDGLSVGVVKTKGGYSILVPKQYVKILGLDVVPLISHELAHIKLKHIEKMFTVYMGTIILSSILGVVSFVKSFYLGILVFPVVMNTVFNMVVSKFEDSADAYAVKFVSPVMYINSLKKIVTSVKALNDVNEFAKNHTILSKIFLVHSELNKRLEKIRV